MKEVVQITRYTPEQESAINCAVKGADLGIVANAGSGKSTTLLGIAAEQCLNGKSGLYLAFNRSVKEAAEARFSRHNTKVKTVYGLGYGYVVCLGKINRARIGNVTTKHVANFLTRKGSSSFTFCPSLHDFLASKNDSRAEQFVVNGLRLGTLVMNTIQAYLHSADIELSVKHAVIEGFSRVLNNDFKNILADKKVKLPAGILQDVELAMKNGHVNLEPLRVFLVDLANEVINDMRAWEGDLSVMHDIYLKEYANLLTTGEIKPPKVDYVMFDEFQDANGVMLALVESLRKNNSQVIAVGDPHQRIYSFLHTKDAFASTNFDEYRPLTQSFRFGPEIAELVGNFVRSTMDPHFVIRGNESLPSVVDVLPGQVPYSAIVCRSNTGVFEEALEVLATGGVPYAPKSNEVKKLVSGMIDLKNGQKTECPELAVFSSHDELVEYSETDEGKPFRRLLKVLDKYGDKFVLSTIDKLGNFGPETTTHVMTTHAAKGLEFSTVKLGADFDVLQFMEPDMTEEEIKEAKNVKYVALTRAIQVLDPYQDEEAATYGPASSNGARSMAALSNFRKKVKMAAKTPKSPSGKTRRPKTGAARNVVLEHGT